MGDGEPLALLKALHGAVAGAIEHRAADEPAGPWLGAWRALDAATLTVRARRAAVAPQPSDALTEPRIAHTLATALGADATLVVGASLPIRMLERWAPAVDAPPVVLSNRGANGIDGVTSTAFGVLAARQSRRAGHSAARGRLPRRSHAAVPRAGSRTRRRASRCSSWWSTTTAAAIFERLASRAAPGALEQRILTPQGRDLAHLAAFYDLELLRPSTVGELQAALSLAIARPMRAPPLIELHAFGSGSSGSRGRPLSRRGAGRRARRRA